MPPILIVLRDARDRIVYSWEVQPPKRSLAPGESVTVNEAVTDVPALGQVRRDRLEARADRPAPVRGLSAGLALAAARTALLRARSYPAGAAVNARPIDLAVVAELVDAQR